jgi:hypothetical protein
VSTQTILAKGVVVLFGSLVGLTSLATKSDSKIAVVPACRSEQLQTLAYGAGVATGTEYLAIAITNTGPTRCKVGSEIQLMRTERGALKILAAEIGTTLFGERLNVLNAQQRAVALISTTWAAGDDRNPNCPNSKPRPVDRVTAIKLSNGTTSVVTNPFDLDRCLRHVSPLADDKWLTQCERETRPVCQPIPSDTRRPKIR